MHLIILNDQQQDVFYLQHWSLKKKNKKKYFVYLRKQGHMNNKENKISLLLDIFIVMFYAKKATNILKIFKGRKCESKILYPVKLMFKYKVTYKKLSS